MIALRPGRLPVPRQLPLLRELLLFTFGFQVNTPSADDPIVALSGTDTKPAIDGFNPGVGADLYTTNGETTDFAHARQGRAGVDAGTRRRAARRRVRLSGQGRPGPERVRQDPALCSRRRALGCRPRQPVSHLKIEVEPFYLNVAEIDPQKSHNNPLSDFRFAYSYNGASQTVHILANRDIDNDGSEDAVTTHWSINGGPTQSDTPASGTGGGLRRPRRRVLPHRRCHGHGRGPR